MHKLLLRDSDDKLKNMSKNGKTLLRNLPTSFNLTDVGTDLVYKLFDTFRDGSF